MGKRSILIFTAAAAALAGLSCEEESGVKPQAAAATQPVAVSLAPTSREAIPETVGFIGTLYGDEEALVASKVSGRIVEILADLGDRADDGQALARVDPTDYELIVEQRDLALREALSRLGLDELPPADFDLATIATVRRAAVQADNARARLDRAKQLFEQDPPLISAQEYGDTQTQYEVAKQDHDVALLEVKSTLALARSRSAELAVARQQLADTQIRAPLAGGGATTRPGRWAIAERRTNIGEYVQAGTVVFRVVADQPIKLRTAVPEQFLGRVRKGQDVLLHVEGQPTDIRGTISRVSPAIDTASLMLPVEATFANADRVLKPGAFGRGEILIGTRDNVTAVPAAALYSFAGLNRVFTVKDGKAVANTVTVLARDDEQVIVEGDLGGAGEVVVGGLARLANGIPVTIAPATQPTSP